MYYLMQQWKMSEDQVRETFAFEHDSMRIYYNHIGDIAHVSCPTIMAINNNWTDPCCEEISAEFDQMKSEIATEETKEEVEEKKNN